ncbi:MAG TPA: site-2 protease family protein [Tepidiformaceae bacterium]|nr:site-2 protease family protein [Tepidiformaceae bacterium]
MIWYISDLQENPAAFLVFVAAFSVAVLTGLAFHEFCHAWSANELGDDTAKRQGRLTLNPMKHLDPIGTTLLFVMGFGWAKPVMVNPWRLRIGPRRGHALVAFAGPASNFFFAALAAIPIRLGLIALGDDVARQGQGMTVIEAVIRFGDGMDYAWLFLSFIIGLNILLGIFNLIPIPPLDGFRVLTGIVPREIARGLEQIAPWGPGILMAFIALGFLTGRSPIIWVINLVYDDILGIILGT